LSIESFFIHIDDEITNACSQILTSKSKDVLTFKLKDSPEHFRSLYRKTKHVGSLTLKTKSESITCKMLTLNGAPIISLESSLDKRLLIKQSDLRITLN